MSTAEPHGPIDFVVIEFAGGTLSGAAQLSDLVERGTIRLYDLVVVRAAEDGTAVEVSFDDPSVAGYDAFAGARSGLLDGEDLDLAAATLQPGSLAAVVVYENAWAVPFVAAALDGGGDMVASARISAQDVTDTLDALDASS